VPSAQSPVPTSHPFQHTERLRPLDSNALPAAPPPRSWFFEPDNPSDSSAPSAPSAFNAPRAAHNQESPVPEVQDLEPSTDTLESDLPTARAPESPRAP
jgi:hypothetical protein